MAIFRRAEIQALFSAKRPATSKLYVLHVDFPLNDESRKASTMGWR
jgi:hypothetical protein